MTGRSDQSFAPGQALPSLERHQNLTPTPTSALQSARAIRRALRGARRTGQTPEAVVLSADLHQRLQHAALSYLWSTPKRDVLFGVPVEVNREAEGWTVRVR